MQLSQGQIERIKARVARLAAGQQHHQATANKNATVAHTGAALPGAKTIDELVATFNSFDNPIDRTLWWRENFQQIKLAQRRERFQAIAEGREPAS